MNGVTPGQEEYLVNLLEKYLSTDRQDETWLLRRTEFTDELRLFPSRRYVYKDMTYWISTENILLIMEVYKPIKSASHFGPDEPYSKK